MFLYGLPTDDHLVEAFYRTSAGSEAILLFSAGTAFLQGRSAAFHNTTFVVANA
jgi:hypothetical protein